MQQHGTDLAAYISPDSIDPIEIIWITPGDLAAAFIVFVLLIAFAFAAGCWSLRPHLQQPTPATTHDGDDPDATVELPRHTDYDLAGGR